MSRAYFSNEKRSDLKIVKSFLACLLALVLLWVAMPALSDTAGSEGKSILEESLRRMTVQCYALEGRYPPNLEYLEKHYGLYYNTDRYWVDYRIFASNLLPDITVLDRVQQ